MIIKLSQGLCDVKCLLSPPLNSKVTGGILDKHHQPMGCCFLWEAKKAVELAVIFPTERNSSKLSYIPHGCNPSQKKKPETTKSCFTFFFVHHCRRNYSVKQTFWQNNHFYWMGINSISFKSWRCVICTSTPNVQYIQFIPVQSLFLPPLPTPFGQIFSGKHAVSTISDEQKNGNHGPRLGKCKDKLYTRDSLLFTLTSVWRLLIMNSNKSPIELLI
jgi:hypothetical protein